MKEVKKLYHVRLEESKVKELGCANFSQFVREAINDALIERKLNEQANTDRIENTLRNSRENG